MSEGSQQNITAFQQAMATMAGFVGGQAIIGAFNAVKDAALGFFKALVSDGVAAAQVQEDAVNSLNAALARTGQFSDETSQSLQNFASEMQKTTRFGDELLLKNMALIQSLGGLEEDGLKRATQAAADLSAALGIDLQAAATLVGKAATGEVASFSRYGVAIEKGKDAAETFSNTLEALERKFGGAAQQDVKTYSGLTQQLANTWGDVTEQVGFAITKNSALLNVMAEMQNILGGVEDELGNNNEAWRELIAMGLIVAIEVMKDIIHFTDIMIKTWQTAVGVVQSLLTPLRALAWLWNAYQHGVEEANKVFSEGVNEAYNNLTAFANDTEPLLQTVVDKLDDMQMAAHEGLADIQTGADASVVAYNNVKDTVVELTEAEKKRAQQLSDFANALLAASESQKEVYAMDLENLQLNLEEKLITEDEYWVQRLELLTERHQQENDLLEAARAQGKITEEEFQKARTQLERQQLAEHRKLALQRQKEDEKMEQERMRGMQQYQQGVLGLTRSGNKQVGGASKSLASFQATTNAYAAIQNALANVPYPANIAAAAGIGAQAFANVARINSVSLNRGGTVPGSGPNRDTVPAMLTPGEEVVNRSTAEMLREFLEGQREGGSLRVELSMSENMMELIEANILERQRVGVSLLRTRLA